MQNEIFINTDAICCVLSQKSSSAIVFAILDKFLPNRETLNLDYCEHPIKSGYIFKSEEELVSCFADNSKKETLLFWKSQKNNDIMVGANFKSNNSIIFSITVFADNKTEFFF